LYVSDLGGQAALANLEVFAIVILSFRVLEYGYEWQVAIAFGIIEAIANHEMIRDLEA